MSLMRQAKKSRLQLEVACVSRGGRQLCGAVHDQVRIPSFDGVGLGIRDLIIKDL